MRLTLRCLRQDLGLPVPAARVPLDQVEHPLLRKAAGQFADPATSRERIRAIDDVVLFKAKVGRWRGAVFTDEPEAEVRDWLVAAGIREDGSADDFYSALHQQAVPPGSATTPTTTSRLPPTRSAGTCSQAQTTTTATGWKRRPVSCCDSTP